ncbi:carbon starvation protein A [Maribellus sp. YY47]|uniref:carbon starvation CstA family protein n=1 Tax=Maribellus sp. YY47 TaxID=2929486 RepID=UPI002001A4C6|nr:carbon starvation protein A [Maribellus sp. YY47]MCK3683123.1 carbon starvation protein A [Maribellus sp. YY47]
MITFSVSLIILILGYILYSRIVERIGGIDPARETPAYSMKDGVDYLPLPWWRIFLIQFLNIAGLGPIFGAIAGAMWGPVAFLWIVLGSVFAGAVHDYFSGMLSIKHRGLSITEIVGIYLGTGAKQFMRGFTVILMIIVGAVFIMGPAKILAGLTPGVLSMTFWVWVVFVYYLLATMLPIDKIIGRLYPIFGFALVFMALGLIIALFVKGYHIPELNLASITNFHSESDKFPIFPMLFITIACGAISGFHATQSPLMARCLTNEKYGRRVFYGAMITEGVVALIWAAIGMSFFGGIRELNDVMNANNGNAAFVVNEISNSLLGTLGGVLALLGVVAAPITSGDTAFRSARLIVADFLNLKQKSIGNRLLISIPLFLIGFLLTQIDFSIIWRYFAWSNQTLATVVLWTITVYLAKEQKFYWMTLIPAVFMTAVITTYLMFAPEGFSLSKEISYSVGMSISVISLAAFFVYLRALKKEKVKQTAF